MDYAYGPYGVHYILPIHPAYAYGYRIVSPVYGYLDPGLPSDYADILQVFLTTHLSSLTSPAAFGVGIPVR